MLRYFGLLFDVNCLTATQQGSIAALLPGSGVFFGRTVPIATRADRKRIPTPFAFDPSWQAPNLLGEFQT